MSKSCWGEEVFGYMMEWGGEAENKEGEKVERGVWFFKSYFLRF